MAPSRASLAAFMLLAPLLSPLEAPAQRLSLVDRIVAVVNKEVITLSELNEAMGAATRQLRRQGTQAPPREVLERQMLERLILDKAQLQMAKETGIRVEETQVDRAVQRVAEQNKLTLADFRAALERDGIPFDAFRSDLRDQIVLTRLREREVDDKIQVSDTEIDLFLQETSAQSAERAEYNLAHILVRVPEQATPERIEASRANRYGRGFRRARARQFRRLHRGPRRRPRLDLPGRHGAGVRACLPGVETRRNQPACEDAFRLSPDPGAGTPFGRHESRTATAPGAAGATRAQVRRGFPAVAAPAARPDVRGFAPGGAIGISSTIAVTSGEPAGIGPEICALLAKESFSARIVVIGDRGILPGGPTVHHVPPARPRVPGKLDPANSRYVLRLLDRAVQGCLAGELEAMVTAPVQKSVINDAGIAFTGHTEYLAEPGKAGHVVMMLVGGGLRVALATTHLPLAQVPRAITTDGLLRTLRVLDKDLKQRFK